MVDIENEREKFETTCKQGLFVRKLDVDFRYDETATYPYRYDTANVMFEAWLACAEANQLEIQRLRDALKELIWQYVKLLEAGKMRIEMLGGECDAVDKMEAGDPALIAAKQALSPITEKEV
jgi:hypothetical protein